MSENTRPAAPPEPAARPERPADEAPKTAESPPGQPGGEVNGPRGPEPTRFGDWEKNGRCFDF